MDKLFFFLSYLIVRYVILLSLSLHLYIFVSYKFILLHKTLQFIIFFSLSEEKKILVGVRIVD